MDKEYELNMTISSKDDKYDSAQINEMFVKWAEENELSVTGSIVLLTPDF